MDERGTHEARQYGTGCHNRWGCFHRRHPPSAHPGFRRSDARRRGIGRRRAHAAGRGVSAGAHGGRGIRRAQRRTGDRLGDGCAGLAAAADRHHRHCGQCALPTAGQPGMAAIRGLPGCHVRRVRGRLGPVVHHHAHRIPAVDPRAGIPRRAQRFGAHPGFLCGVRRLPDHGRPTPYALRREMELEHTVYAGHPAGGAVLELGAGRGVLLRRGADCGHGVPFRHRHAQPGCLGAADRGGAAEHRSRRGLAGAPSRGARRIRSAPDHAG